MRKTVGELKKKCMKIVREKRKRRERKKMKKIEKKQQRQITKKEENDPQLCLLGSHENNLKHN